MFISIKRLIFALYFVSFSYSADSGSKNTTLLQETNSGYLSEAKTKEDLNTLIDLIKEDINKLKDNINSTNININLLNLYNNLEEISTKIVDSNLVILKLNQDQVYHNERN